MADKHGKLSAGLYGVEQVKATNPIKIQDITFRDGHQSLFATRGRTEDMIPVLEKMDNVGFWALGVWGGATFDCMHRFLGEDPWERPRTIKKYVKKTPLQMLLRGQNLVAYRNHPDDVAEAFVERAAINGIDVFRVFDAVNDLRNFITPVKIIKKMGKHFQGTICYSLTQPRMGGDVYNIEYYVKKAKQLEDMGADTVCIKDMAGLISPYDAYMMVKALKESVKVPIHLHSHFTSGQADMALLKAVEAGVDIIDTCLAPWAHRTSHPALEPLVVTLMNTSRDPGFNLKTLAEIDEYIETISPKYKHLLDDTKCAIIDVGVLLHQTPGGMVSNLVNQLREMGAIDRLNDVYKELPRVRKEMGQVPLVTPTSQIVGIQTVNNVLFDTPEERYKMVTAQGKDLYYGLYGETPAPLDPEIQKKALKGYPRGEKPITCRPADIIEPELEKFKAVAGDLAKNIDDLLIVCLYPTTGVRFLKWKYGKEPFPDEVKPKTLEKVAEEDRLAKLAKQGKLVEKVEKKAPEKGPAVRTFNVFVDKEYYEVEVDEVGGAPVVTAVRPQAVAAPAPAAAPRPAAAPAPKPAAAPVAAPAPAVEGGTPIVAPMPGMIIRYEKKVGDAVKQGDVVLILEAMKMENSITAPAAGKVVSIPFEKGQSVAKGAVLAVIG
ncbi:MAG TPA: pyruvate carboxylase subunit B [Syntrophobacteria bacterium]|nr:pyruvate carboxylase subunit B [Syntrophobacteria bacterium]